MNTISKPVLNGEPIYLQIEYELRMEITSGLRSPGELLPSEAALINKYGTSRETVRRGLKELERKGLIYPRPGKGYFVAIPEHNQFTFYFSDEDKGYESKFHRINTEIPSEEVRTALSLPHNGRVIMINRIILLHDNPVAYDEKYLPYNKGEPLLEAEIKYALFPEIINSPPFAFYTKMEIGSERAGKNIGKILECDENESLLVLYRHVIGQDAKHLGYGKKYLTQKWGKLEATSGYGDILL